MVNFNAKVNDAQTSNIDFLVSNNRFKTNPIKDDDNFLCKLSNGGIAKEDDEFSLRQDENAFSKYQELNDNDLDILSKIYEEQADEFASFEPDDIEDVDENDIRNIGDTLEKLGFEGENLEDYTGAQLCDIFDSYKDEYTDDDNCHIKENTALIKLLGNASSNQIEEFFTTYEQNHGYEKTRQLGEDMKLAGYTTLDDIVSEEEYNRFLDNMTVNSEFVPIDTNDENAA